MLGYGRNTTTFFDDFASLTNFFKSATDMLTHRKKTFKTRYFSFNHVKTLIEEAQLKHNVPFKIENCNAVSEGE